MRQMFGDDGDQLDSFLKGELVDRIQASFGARCREAGRHVTKMNEFKSRVTVGSE